jgi:hypothetical protein
VLVYWLFACTLSGGQSESADGVLVTFNIVAQAEGSAFSGTLVLNATNGAAHEIALRSGTVETRLEAGSAWRVELLSADWWLDPIDLTVSPTASPVMLRIWPVTVVSGVLAVPPSASLPSSVKLVVEAAPWQRATAIARGVEFHCPVLRPSGIWKCRVPAALLDLAVVVSGYIPEYRWGVDLTGRRAFDMGRVTLREGASVVAWLAPAPDAKRPWRATATLLRQVAPHPSPTAQQLAAPVAQAAFAANGFVQLAPVPAGTYVLEVQAPGAATERIFPLQVVDQRESALRRAIQLTPPLSFAIAVTPPVDPDGARWAAHIRRAGDFAAGYDPAPVFNGSLPLTGELTIDGMSAGRFAVTISDAAGNTVADEELDVRAAGARLTIDIPVVPVRGKVTHRDAPVAATLVFGGRHGALNISMRSDESGEFRGWLPRAGKWIVDVRKENDFSAALNAMVSEGRELLLEIPSTSIRGRVLDSQGAVADAKVVAVGAGGLFLETRSNEEGKFAFSGLDRGTYSIGARSAKTGEASEHVAVELPANDSEREVTLELRSRSAITGLVFSNGSPVVGAQVDVFVFGLGGQVGGNAVTDIHGRFTVAVPAGAERALFVVRAPARALRAFDRTLSSDLRFEIETRGGGLELTLPQDHNGWALFQDGVALPSFVIFDWARGHGSIVRPGAPLDVPDVAVGHYRLCARLTDNSMPCAEGQVVPGGTLRLDLSK